MYVCMYVCMHVCIARGVSFEGSGLQRFGDAAPGGSCVGVMCRISSLVAYNPLVGDFISTYRDP